jgi:membrane associated rhomboid family serine protease
MMIVPIHQRLHWGNIPWMSVAIALVCIWIFAVPQQRDNLIYDEAAALYDAHRLQDIEAPLYRAYAESHPDAYIHELGEPVGDSVPPEILQWDRGFRSWLKSGEAFASEHSAETWRDESRWFDEKIASTWTERYSVRSESPTVFQSLTSSFLHGDWGHLFGNLLFLMILGFLVERALGPWLYLAVYLLCSIAASWLWAVTSEPWLYSVGASGGISGMMGALCVLWGFRKIRFFYWFIVVFDYVRAPAVLLLLPWLGWEFWNWGTRDGSSVAYSSHAGGIIAGAALALIAKGLRWDRADAYEDSFDAVPSREKRVAELRSAIGRLDVSRAEGLLPELLKDYSKDAEIQTLAIRSAMMGRQAALAAERSAKLVLSPINPDEREMVIAVLEECGRLGGRWNVPETLAYAGLLLDHGLSEKAAGQLAEKSIDVGAEIAGPWLRIAFERSRDGDLAGSKILLERLIESLPGTPEAGKARAHMRG